MEVPEDLYSIMRYIVETYGSYDEQVVREIIRQVQPEEEEKMLSQFAQDIITQGKPKWAQMVRQEGEQKGGATLLLLLLEEKFDKISDSIQNKVLAAERSTIEKWSRRILKATTLDDVFGV